MRSPIERMIDAACGVPTDRPPEPRKPPEPLPDSPELAAYCEHVANCEACQVIEPATVHHCAEGQRLQDAATRRRPFKRRP